ncbi:hypothetical protein RY26_24370 [Pseudomonas fluorescens]|nr:hypothetical protein RY26_24370 [Pseudomonas fluorescens]
MSGAIRRPERSSRLWIGSSARRLRASGRPATQGEIAYRGNLRFTSTLKGLVGHGFTTTPSRRRTSAISPNQSPLPRGGPTFREG